MQSTANQVLQSGGKIVWLSRDLRGSRVRATSHHFRDALEYAKRDGNPVVVALDMSAAAGAVGGASLNSCGPQGLTTDEILDLAMIAGADPNVSFPDCSFSIHLCSLLMLCVCYGR